MIPPWHQHFGCSKTPSAMPLQTQAACDALAASRWMCLREHEHGHGKPKSQGNLKGPGSNTSLWPCRTTCREGRVLQSANSSFAPAENPKLFFFSVRHGPEACGWVTLQVHELCGSLSTRQTGMRFCVSSFENQKQSLHPPARAELVINTAHSTPQQSLVRRPGWLNIAETETFLRLLGPPQISASSRQSLHSTPGVFWRCLLGQLAIPSVRTSTPEIGEIISLQARSHRC